MKEHHKDDTQKWMVITFKNNYTTAKCWYCLLTIIVLLTSNINAQTVVQLSPRVGKEIQYSNLRYFGLFSTIDNGTSAIITFTDSMYTVRLTRPDLLDTTLQLTQSEFKELQQYVDTYESILYDDYVHHYQLIQPFTHYVQYSELGENITVTTIDGEVHTKKLLYANDEYIVLKTSSEDIDISKAIGTQVLIFSYKDIAAIGTNNFKYGGTIAGLGMSLLGYAFMNNRDATLLKQNYGNLILYSSVYKLVSGIASDLLYNNTLNVNGNQEDYIKSIERFKENTFLPKYSSGVMPEVNSEINNHASLISSKLISIHPKPTDQTRKLSISLRSPNAIITPLTDTTRKQGDTLHYLGNEFSTNLLVSGSILYAISTNQQIGFDISMYKDIPIYTLPTENFSLYNEATNVNFLYKYNISKTYQNQFQTLNYSFGFKAGVGKMNYTSSSTNFIDIGIEADLEYHINPFYVINFNMFLQRNFYGGSPIIDYNVQSKDNRVPLQLRTLNNYLFGVNINAGICL